VNVAVGGLGDAAQPVKAFEVDGHALGVSMRTGLDTPAEPN
jgi:hypothetical protein